MIQTDGKNAAAGRVVIQSPPNDRITVGAETADLPGITKAATSDVQNVTLNQRS